MAKEAKTATLAAEKSKTAAVNEAAADKAVSETMTNDQKRIAELEKQIEELKKLSANPQVVQLAVDTEKVYFLWQADVADDNVIFFGEGGMYGRIVGRVGSFYIPKNDLSRILNEQIRNYLEKRWLIITDGLTKEEREALGVDYAEGEVLKGKLFTNIVEMGDKILEIYPALCKGHKEIVAKRYVEAYAAGNATITRERVVKLNELSKTKENERGDFFTIIEEMNKKDAM